MDGGLDLNSDFERFVRELEVAEKIGQDAICLAVRKGIGGLRRTFHGIKKQMILRGAEALEKTVSDPHTISSILKKSLNGQVGRDYVHHCLPAKYKSIERGNYASMRGKTKASINSTKSTTITLDFFGIGGPKTQNGAPHTSSRNPFITPEPHATRSSSVGITVARAQAIVIAPRSIADEQIPIEVNEASLSGLSGKVVLTLIMPVTALGVISAIRDLTSGYREEHNITGHTEFISRSV